MDTRRHPSSREDERKPEIGTDTVPVELVELQTIGSSGMGRSPRAILAIALTGIVAFAAIVAAGKTLTPTPSPTSPVTGLASASPAATHTAAPSLATPTLPPPTLRPTPPPAWLWTRSDFLPDLRPSVEGMWAVNGRVLSLINRYDTAVDRESWSIARLIEPNDWEIQAAPPAIDRFFAGSVIDDRLWFLARVSGINAADATWELVSTDGETWDSLGTVSGLPAFDWATILTRTGDTWVMVTGREMGMGASSASISWSADGRHWKAASLPEFRSNVGYTRAASISGATLMLGFDFDSPEDNHWFVLRSTDGRTWQRPAFPLPPMSSARDLICDDLECIVTVQPFDTAPALIQTIMLSRDGEDWGSVGVTILNDDQDATVERIATTATGFIAVTSNPALALLSTDGWSWRALDVLPSGNQDYVSDLVVVGDMVVAFVPRQSIEPDRLWTGSLAAMGN